MPSLCFIYFIYFTSIITTHSFHRLKKLPKIDSAISYNALLFLTTRECHQIKNACLLLIWLFQVAIKNPPLSTFTFPLQAITACQINVLLGHHHLHELLVVDLSIPVDIRLTNHLVHFLVCKLLAEVGHDVAKLGGRDETVTIFVENFERFQDLFLPKAKKT